MEKQKTLPQAPASLVIERFGGVCELSRLLDLDKSTVSRWQPESSNGTRGFIPRKYWGKLLRLAKVKQVPLTLSDLAGLDD